MFECFVNHYPLALPPISLPPKEWASATALASPLVVKEHEPHLPLHYLQLWDCFAYSVAVTDFNWLHEMRVQVILRDRQVCDGAYMFTVDWFGNNDSEEPGEDGHKNAHVIQLECGCLVAQPNNRIIWHEPSVITSPCDLRKGERPDYLINTHKWKCEIDSKWTAENSYAYFYDDNNHGESFTQEQRVEIARLRALSDANWPEEKWNINVRRPNDRRGTLHTGVPKRSTQSSDEHGQEERP